VLENQVQQLQAARPRDEADAALRQMLARSTDGLPFTSADLFAHAALDPALQDALADATIGNVAEFGSWLRDQQGIRAGVVIERLRRRRWRAYTSST
jgi:hypothetical protein